MEEKKKDEPTLFYKPETYYKCETYHIKDVESDLYAEDLTLCGLTIGSDRSWGNVFIPYEERKLCEKCAEYVYTNYEGWRTFDKKTKDLVKQICIDDFSSWARRDYVKVAIKNIEIRKQLLSGRCDDKEYSTYAKIVDRDNKSAIAELNSQKRRK